VCMSAGGKVFVPAIASLRASTSQTGQLEASGQPHVGLRRSGWKTVWRPLEFGNWIAGWLELHVNLSAPREAQHTRNQLPTQPPAPKTTTSNWSGSCDDGPFNRDVKPTPHPPTHTITRSNQSWSTYTPHTYTKLRDGRAQGPRLCIL